MERPDASGITDRMHPCVKSTQPRTSPPLTGRDAQCQITCCTERPVIPALASHVGVKYRARPVPIPDVSGLF
jgi:hypothetical protein